MIEVKNSAHVSRQIDEWFADVAEETTQVAKGMAGFALYWLAEHSPQYSGDFAANWKVMINGIDTSFEEFRKQDANWFNEPRQQGDKRAVYRSLLPGYARLASFKLGDTINISNSAHHYLERISHIEDGIEYYFFIKDSYAWKIEDDKIKFRPENSEKGRVIGRFVDLFETRYRQIDGHQANQFASAGRLKQLTRMAV